MTEKIENSLAKLKEYCEQENFKGWDPYDGLNSKVFQAVPFFRKSRFFRLAWIQLFKRSPVNLRRCFIIPKEYNPKGIALFLSGYCFLYQSEKKEEYRQKIHFLGDKLIELQSKGWSGSCWGYNFDWQARAFFQPKYTPTVVATAFCAYALLDAYQATGNKKYRQTALSSADFVLKDLNRTFDSNGDFAFSYSPLDNTQVFNASLLGSKLLSRLYFHTKNPFFIQEAKKSIRFCVKHQQKDGSWTYSTLPYQQWIDNFHTGYNIESLYEYQRYSGDTSFQKNIDKGLAFYLKTFFTQEGIPKYYHDKIYPIDIHCPAQLTVTLCRMKMIEHQRKLIEKVLHWTIDNMQHNKGYFYYQLKKSGNSRIPYMRWAQAWMFYALSFLKI